MTNKPELQVAAHELEVHLSAAAGPNHTPQSLLFNGAYRSGLVLSIILNSEK